MRPGLDPHRYAALASAADVDFLIAAAARAGGGALEILARDESGGVRSERAPSVHEAHFAYRRGATLRVNGADRHAPALWAFCRELEDGLGFAVRANLYATPAGSRGLQRHFDYLSVFVLQVAGRKRWRVYDAGGRLPLMWGERAAFLGARGGAGGDERVALETELEPGDLLYVPRGFGHEAWTGAEASVHLTLSLHVETWLSLFVAALLAQAEEDPLLREALPWGDPPPELAARRGELLARLAAADLGAVRAGMREALARASEPGAGTLFDLAAAPAVDDDFEAEIRPGIVSSLAAHGDEAVLAFGFTRVRETGPAARALAAIRALRRFRVRDLGGDDPALRARLVERLIAAGFLRSARP